LVKMTGKKKTASAEKGEVQWLLDPTILC
jgi:hypothetical protein